MEKRFDCLEGYLEEYGALAPVTDPWIADAIEGGYTDVTRAATLLSRLLAHPLIAATYPYRNLCAALEFVTAPGCWTPGNEEAVLLFLQALQDWDRYDLPRTLLNAPAHLFGDTYNSLFHSPVEPVDLRSHVVEFTGPFTAGTHDQLVARAVAGGARIVSRWSRPTMLFVAEAHIAERVLSTKMLDAITARAKIGSSVLIVRERHFPT